jgi:hypothetical protein
MKLFWALLIIASVSIAVLLRNLVIRALVVIIAVLWGISDLYLYTFGRNTVQARAQKGMVPQEYVNGVVDAETAYHYIRYSVSIVLLVVLLIALRSLYDAYEAGRRNSKALSKDAQ